MGYREYFLKADKNMIEELRQATDCDDIVNICRRYDIDIKVEKLESGVYCNFSPYLIAKEIFEFGKYYEGSDKVQSNGIPLFQNDSLREQYSDYNMIICNRDAIKAAILWQHEKIKNLYEELVAINEESKKSQLERIKRHCSDYLYWWKNTSPYDLELPNENLTSSWLYEHTIFDLVRIYKTFDFENYHLLFCGW